MIRGCLLRGVLLAAGGLAAGCGGLRVPADDGGERPELEASDFYLPAEPDGARGAMDVNARARDGEAVVVVGRVGGPDPFVGGEVAFTLVDPELEGCTRPDCETPWDYCTTDRAELDRATVLVRLVDDRGQPLAGDAREFLGVQPLHLVYAQGRVRRAGRGIPTVLATRIYIRTEVD